MNSNFRCEYDVRIRLIPLLYTLLFGILKMQSFAKSKANGYIICIGATHPIYNDRVSKRAREKNNLLYIGFL